MKVIKPNTREPSYHEVSARQQCVYEGPWGRNLRSAENRTLARAPYMTNQHVDRQSGCDVMAIFEIVKNIRYRYQRLRLQSINLNYGSIYILLSYLLTAHRSFP